MRFWRQLAQNRLLDVGAAAIALMCVGRIAAVLPSRATQNDFAHYYVTSRMMWNGENPYPVPLAPRYAQYGLVFQEEVPVATNPPVLLWMFAPLALLPARVAFAAWLAVQVASLCVILWLTRRLLGERLTPRGFRFVCAATVASAAVYWHFYYSQMQLLLAALVLAAYTRHRAGNHVTACLVATVAGLIKLYPFVLLPWFVGRCGGDVRLRAARAMVALSVGVVVVFITDLSRWRDFFHYGMPQLASYAINHSFNFTVPSLVTNLGYAAYDFAPPVVTARVWWAVGAMVGLAMMGLAYLAVVRAVRDPEAEFCLLCVAMLVGSFKAEGHYFVFLIFPVAVAAARVAERISWRSLIGFCLLLLCLNNLGTYEAPWLDRHLYLKILCNYTPLYGLLALGVFFANELRVKTRLGGTS
jgi:hypothetical protein